MAKAQKIEKNGYSLRLAKVRDGKNFDESYSIEDALKNVKECATAKFDESIDISINLGIDTKQSDQSVRGVVSLPNGTGKKVTVAAFVADETKAKEAKAAGAKIVGSDDLLEAIKKGEINFDKLIATPDMMPKLGQVAKILGPKGLMPNPKLGSVTENIAEAVKSALAGQVEFRAEKGGVIHAIVGKKSFEDKKLIENIKTLIEAVKKQKPSSTKGIYIKKISISSTMGAGFRVIPSSVTE